MSAALEALTRLRDGNRRFAGETAMPALSTAARRVALVAGQEPFAIILGCSDSRVPAELVFERLIHETGLLVVGAEYSLETGVVDFFDISVSKRTVSSLLSS